MKSKSFKNWTRQDLYEAFGLEDSDPTDFFNNWLNSTEPIDSTEQIRLEELRVYVSKNIDYWNEEELKMNFLGPLLQLVNFSGKNYRIYYDRPVSVIVNDIKLLGRLDGVVANGFQDPVSPYFCIHEYKQENNREGDPKGQLLAGMMAVQALNHNNNRDADRPIFGCSVLARSWYFMLLVDKKYVASDVFACTHQDDFLQIFRMLRFIKTYIENNQN